MNEELPEHIFDFSKPKPVKCKTCGYQRGLHRAATFQCPAKWSEGRIGFTAYMDTVYEPKAAAIRGVKP